MGTCFVSPTFPPLKRRTTTNHPACAGLHTRRANVLVFSRISPPTESIRVFRVHSRPKFLPICVHPFNLRQNVLSVASFASFVVSLSPGKNVFHLPHLSYHLAQLNHLNMLRTLRPIVYPAHNHVAFFWIVPVQQEIAAFKFKFNPTRMERIRSKADFSREPRRMHTNQFIRAFSRNSRPVWFICAGLRKSAAKCGFRLWALVTIFPCRAW